MAKITVKTRGPAAFRRAGRDWGPQPTEVDASEFTPEQLEQLRAESEPGGMLEVTGLPAAPRGTPPGVQVHHDAGPSKGELQTGGGKTEGGEAPRTTRR